MQQLKTAIACLIAGSFLAALTGCSGEQEELKLSEKQEKLVSERLAPVGEVALASEAGSASAGSASGPRSSEEIYNSKCIACHGTGVAGAPKLGVASDWENRIAQGMDVVYANAIKGIRGMPAKGLCLDCSDEEITAVVDYMLP